MTVNEQPKKVLSNTLALSSSGLAVTSVMAGYFLQTQWGMESYWALLHTITHRGLLLSGALMLLAIVLKRTAHHISIRQSLILRLTSYVILAMSVAFVASSALEIRSKLHIESLPVESRYKFSTDGVSANAQIWSKHLAEFVAKPNIHALEIGSYEGRSALWFLAKILTDDASTITCIDIFDEDFESTFDHNVEASGQGHKVKKLKGDSKSILRTLNGKFDFVYIDGSHVAKDVLVDAVLVWDILKPGGVIIFDDYGLRRSPADNQSPALVPRPAIDAFLNVFRHYIDVLHRDYQVIVKKKTRPDFDSKSILDILRSIPF
jgi:predicted O-methyltransferase YrrM